MTLDTYAGTASTVQRNCPEEFILLIWISSLSHVLCNLSFSFVCSSLPVYLLSGFKTNAKIVLLENFMATNLDFCQRSILPFISSLSLSLLSSLNSLLSTSSAAIFSFDGLVSRGCSCGNGVWFEMSFYQWLQDSDTLQKSNWIHRLFRKLISSRNSRTLFADRFLP